MNPLIRRELATINTCLVLAEHHHNNKDYKFVPSYIEDALKSVKELEKELNKKLDVANAMNYTEKEIDLLMNQIAGRNDLLKVIDEHIKRSNQRFQKKNS